MMKTGRCVQSNERLLKLYESGLPAWAIYMPLYRLPYRPWMRTVRHSFIHYSLHAFQDPQVRCVAAGILWQPSSLPCLGIAGYMLALPAISRATQQGILGVGVRERTDKSGA